MVENAVVENADAEPAASGDATSTPPAAPTAETAPPSGPVAFEQITAAWPAVLKRLESVSRTSWLLATAVQPLAFVTETEVLTLGFASQHDVAKFKGTTPGSGPSDHLRAEPSSRNSVCASSTCLRRCPRVVRLASPRRPRRRARQMTRPHRSPVSYTH